MKRILIVGGTADSVRLVPHLSKDDKIFVTTLGPMGAQCVPSLPNLSTVEGPLDQEGFAFFMAKAKIELVADLSHPFATEVTKNVSRAAQEKAIPYYRYERPGYRPDYVKTKLVESFLEAVAWLKKTEGPIFLTIGSRNLHYFLADPTLKERIYCRVLADSRVLKQLEDMAVDPGRIFAMKGVASEALNIALLEQTGAKVLVTKDSGIAGGVKEKAAAAQALDIPILLVSKPNSGEGAVHDLMELVKILGGDSNGE